MFYLVLFFYPSIIYSQGAGGEDNSYLYSATPEIECRDNTLRPASHMNCLYDNIVDY